MPSNHLILCRPLLLLPSIFPNIRVFSNESALHSGVTLINYLPSLHLRCFFFFYYKLYNSVYFIGCVHACSVIKSCPTFCDPMDCSLPGSSVRGIFQVRTLEWVAISSTKGSSQPRDLTWVSSIARQILHHWTTWEASHWVAVLIKWDFMCKVPIQCMSWSSPWYLQESNI